MIITTVQYGRVVNLGNYENEKLSATATVGEGEMPEDALDNLRLWIDGEANTRKTALSNIETVQNRLSSLRYEQGEMERQTAIMRDTWNKARKFLATVGLDLPESYVLEAEEGEMTF